MVQAKTVLAVGAVILAYYYYKSSTPEIKKPESPVVNTLSGSLKGVISKSREGREFYEYLGIPYAKPPVGKLRFELPQPVEKWEGVRDASKYGSVCLQANGLLRIIEGDEDCLFLNIYTPKVKKNDKLLPVMVWIHGGMFVFGSGSMYRAEYFLDHDIVLITLNYRLGTLGFLNTGDKVVRGNNGLRDQNLALKWVQANIKSFGGDPKQVTIFGESAGSASVHHHVLSPMSKGLFHKAISQSATAVALWATRTNPVEQAKTFSKRIGCPTDTSEAMVNCLRGIDGTKIIQELSYDLQDTLRDPITVFNPSIEVVKDENTFIAEHPEDIIRKGDFSKVPWIAGITEQEGLLLAGPLLRDSQFKRVIANFDVDFPNLIWKSGPVKPEALQAVKDFYFGKENIDSDDKFQNWTNVMTDSAFGGPTQKAVVLQSVEAPVYAYYYTYKGQFSLTNFILAFPGKLPLMVEYFLFAIPRWVNRNIFGIEPHHYGACHFDEVAMLFPLDGMHNIPPTDKDYQMSKTMVKAWVAFASEPSTQLPNFDGITWPLARTSEGKPKPLQYMHIDAKSVVIDEPNHERNKFWNNLKL